MSARPFTSLEILSIADNLARLNRHRDRLMLLLGVATGYRQSELSSVRVSQIWNGSNSTNEVTVARRLLKGGSGIHRASVRSRRVVLAPSIQAEIREYFSRICRNARPDDFVFMSREGENRPISMSQAHRIIVKAAIGAGVDPVRVSTHSMRKTFVARVHSATGDLVKTQRIMNHASPTITAKYIETFQDDLDRIVLAAAC